MYINSYIMTTNFRLYNNISQILLLYKTWGYYNKFYSTKSLRVYYWYVKILQWHGVWIKKCCLLCSKTYGAMDYNPLLLCDIPLRAPTFVRLVYWAEVPANGMVMGDGKVHDVNEYYLGVSNKNRIKEVITGSHTDVPHHDKTFQPCVTKSRPVI